MKLVRIGSDPIAKSYTEGELR